MKDFLTDTGGSSRIKLSGLDQENLAIWTTERVNQLFKDVEDGVIDIKTIKNSPFKDNDPVWKKANLIFEYTPYEVEEIKKCKNDIIYFANHYAQTMTDDGIQQITLRDYQEEILISFKENRMNILNASRQIGKSVMAAIFIAWFLIFNTEKNVLTVANIATTTKEVMDKIKSILEHLPFFMKPGCVSNNVMSMKFDNGCRLIGRTTTKNTGIGFTVHLLYIDEFAHINPSYLNFFYRAIYPTISASTSKSKIIITSTPNGMNKFYEIYMDALNGRNQYTPLRVDWWQVPGRDEAWKKFTIADLGSEEDFNQEYGLQFFSSDVLLLPSKTLKKIFNLRIEYRVPEWAQKPDVIDLLDGLQFHPNMARMTVDDIKNDPNYYIFSVDTADGLNRDYSIVNIFKFVALPVKMLENVKEFVKVETDVFAVVQVGTFRTNTKDINQYCNSLEHLLFNVFNPEKVRLLVELNHKGEYIMDKITKNENYWSGMLVFSKHSELAQNWKPGLRLTVPNKIKYCERFKYLTAVHKILPNEFRTVHELGSFGRTKNGTYRSQSGNDDLAMTCVNLAAFFESPNFWEIANAEIDRLSKDYVVEVHEKYLKDIYFDKRTKYDYSTLNDLNTSGVARSSGASQRVAEDYLNSYKDTLKHFYGGDQNELQEYKDLVEKYRNQNEGL
jgi:hypothetical protein